jgi:hypothetical protein
VYLYTPDDIDRERAHHQAVTKGADDVDVGEIQAESLHDRYEERA